MSMALKGKEKEAEKEGERKTDQHIVREEIPVLLVPRVPSREMPVLWQIVILCKQLSEVLNSFYSTDSERHQPPKVSIVQ